MKKPPKGIGLYLIRLKSGEQKYQSRLWNPRLGRLGKQHTWQDKDLNMVLRSHLDLKQAYERNNFEIVEARTKPKKRYHPQFIIECAALYEKYLRDDPEYVLPHQARRRDAKYIKNTMSYITNFFTSLKREGYKLSHMHISAVNEETAGIFYNYLSDRYENDEIGEVTFNRQIDACRYWIRTLIDKFSYKITNPFEGIPNKKVIHDPQFLELDEFEKMLSSIKPGNGIGRRGKTKIEQVNYYRDWLPNYLIVSMFVGARTYEMATLRWSDVDNNYIVISNRKVDNLKSSKGNKNYVYIHPDLAGVLAHLRSRAGSNDEYVLVPESTNRRQLRTFVSKAFRHFLLVAGIEKNVTLKNLRHTYVNALYNLIGEDGLSVHHKKETAIRNYLSTKKRLELEEGKRLFNLDITQYIAK